MIKTRFYGPFVFSWLLILLLLCFAGCYSIEQGFTMLGYLNKSVPLANADEDFYLLVTDIRSFAINELGLKESKNYTTYVELDRDYLAAVVSASAKDSFARYEWIYPVVGKMPYKGFFDIEVARKERDKLEKKELDVWIRRVDGFSTLGWFKDPLYSYMRDYSAANLANLIIHELVHSTIFIKNQMQFNEEIAEFIGSEGARLYIISRYGEDSDEYRKMVSSEKEDRVFVEFIQELIAELEEAYSVLYRSPQDLLLQKERIIKSAQERFEAEYDKNFSSDRYRNFSSLPINNAYLDLFRLYHDEDNFYAGLYERAGKNLAGFIGAAKQLTKKSGAREQLEKIITAQF